MQRLKTNTARLYITVMGIDMDRFWGLQGLIDTDTLLNMNVCT